MKRLRINIQGQVQGVGFRPCVYRIARHLALTGWIQNTSSGVLIEAQGILVNQLIPHVQKKLPPLAKITQIQSATICSIANEISFKIIESQEGKVNTIITPDASICPQCLQELFDPQSRYFRYPFLNCTHCGPRFTITRNLPYDRKQTSMALFPLCPDCQTDYSNPENRRYHAQPTACFHCGPQLSLPIEELAHSILQGEIIALKSLGGYQLICDARNKAAVARLRARKNRDTKPFALMVANSLSAERIVTMSQQERELLESITRPIVLLEKINEPDSFTSEVAPGLNTLGIMLPYTPLHYLLFNAFAGNKNGGAWLNEPQEPILVVTSANIGGEPLIIEDESAKFYLDTIADKVISYNRPIVTRVDDSVMRMVLHRPMFIRRSRGFVPAPIELPHEIPPTLAVGGHLKNTFCITRGNEAFISQHIGSLNNKATIEFFHESLSHLLRFLDVTPERIAHDMHPDFYTTRFAINSGIPAFAIQHHHAHMASVMAEHGINKTALGLALDGYGYGNQGEAWGGELFLLEQSTYIRLGSFLPLLQPGGEIAAREPWRMAASVLHSLGQGDEIAQRFSEYPQAHGVHHLLNKKINCPSTSSCGRLFDAVSALLGIQLVSHYEGHAAMRLENQVTQVQIMPEGWQLQEGFFDMMPTLKFLANRIEPVTGANLFHGTLIAGLAEWVNKMCRERGVDVVVLSGGCFLNQILAEGLTTALRKSGIISFLPHALPPNDGGISLGQAWIAGNL